MICNTVTNRDFCFALFCFEPHLLVPRNYFWQCWRWVPYGRPRWNWIPACNASTLLVVLFLWPPLIILSIHHIKTTNSTHMLASQHYYLIALLNAPHISPYPMLNSSTINPDFCYLCFIISIIWKRSFSICPFPNVTQIYLKSFFVCSLEIHFKTLKCAFYANKSVCVWERKRAERERQREWRVGGQESK